MIKGYRYEIIHHLLHEVLEWRRYDMELSVAEISRRMTEQAGVNVGWGFVKSWEVGPKVRMPDLLRFNAMLTVYGLSFEEFLEAAGYGRWGHHKQLSTWARRAKKMLKAVA